MGHLAKANSLTKLETIDLTKGWKDRDGIWDSLCGVGKPRAVLVRPDGIVARREARTEMKKKPPSSEPVCS